MTVNWTSAGAPVIGSNILFSVGKGDLDPGTAGIQPTMSVVTDASGNASVQLLSENDIGSATITASDASDSLPTASRTINFVAINADNMSVEAIPSTVGTTSESEFVATVRDASNVNPIPNQTVLFSVSGSNGVLSQPSAVTDLNGRASVGYTSGSAATTQNGVTVTATLASDTNISATTQMTIIQPSLSVVAGTGNTLQTIGEVELGASYLVIVNDSVGAPVANAVVSVIARPVTYGKGRYTVPPMGTAWVQEPGNVITCNSEDANKNGVLDLVPPPSEDIDSDGRLDPAISVVIGATTSADEQPTISDGTITTDASGQGYFLMSYPRSHGNWQEVELEVTASSGGSEAKVFLSATLLGIASDFTDTTISPPGEESPFGTNLSCAIDG